MLNSTRNRARSNPIVTCRECKGQGLVPSTDADDPEALPVICEACSGLGYLVILEEQPTELSSSDISDTISLT